MILPEAFDNQNKGNWPFYTITLFNNPKVGLSAIKTLTKNTPDSRNFNFNFIISYLETYIS
ncbi:hypothetical protein FEM08_28780 [Flavobacterium gilvum]|nr:hypothetical protein FEM08_28780 [Flavobacterium gilvum]